VQLKVFLFASEAPRSFLNAPTPLGVRKVIENYFDEKLAHRTSLETEVLGGISTGDLPSLLLDFLLFFVREFALLL
jgi:hypothetical protein